MADERQKQIYGKVIAETALAVERLKKKELLSEKECLSLIEGIKTFPNEKESLGEKESNALNIDALMNEFYKIAEDSKSKLKIMLTLISDGKVPSMSEREEFNEVIDDLCNRYKTVCDIANEELEVDERPIEGSPISEYYDALKNSKHNQMEQQLNEIKLIIKKFLSVQSLIANLSLALEPFKKDAEELLDRINTGNNLSIEEINDEVAGPKLFVQALECEELNTDEGNDMLDSLEERFSYPSRVTRGLSSKSYYIPSDEGYHNNSEEDITKTVKNVQERKNTTESQDKRNTEELTDTETNETGEKEIASQIENKEENDVVRDALKDQSNFVKAVKGANLILDMDDFGILSRDISGAETKKLSASVFSSDLRKGNVRACKYIIQDIRKTNVISKELLDIRHKMPEAIAEGSLDYLQRKGYLRRYSLVPGGEFYGGSPRLFKALTYKEASKFVEVKQCSSDCIDEFIEELPSRAATRLAMLKLYTYDAENYNKSSEKSYSSNDTFKDESFLYKSHGESDADNDLLFVGAFWTEESECDIFLEAIKDSIENSKHIHKFIISAIDESSAMRLAKVLLESIHELIKDSEVYIFALKSGCFYRYSDNTRVHRKDIWPALTEEAVVADEKTNQSDKVDTITESSYVESKEVKSDNENLNIELLDQKTESTKEIVDSKKITTESIIHSFVSDKKYYCAAAYAKAVSNKDKSYKPLYDLIAYAVNDPMKRCTYSADSVFDMVTDVHDYFSEALMAAIGIRTFFSNQVRYDYNIKAFYSAIKSYPVFDEIPALSSVLFELEEFKDQQKKGMDYYADYHAKSIAQLEDELRIVQHEAKSFYESVILAKKSEKASQRRFLETKKIMFSPNGEIGQYIKTIAENDIEMQSLLVDFLTNSFIKEGTILSEDNIDLDMLWNYIMGYWDQAGEKMMYKIRADLMSHLRSNIVNVTTKAVQIMIRWCTLINLSSDQAEDDGSIAYKKAKSNITGDIHDALYDIEKKYCDATSNERKAGLEAIDYTLNELLRCIEGTYEENEKKFFYAPFLFTDDIILDENFCPVLDVKSIEVEKLQPENRIIDHSKKKKMEPILRLKEILDDGGDDYGCARLIVKYLSITAPDIIVDGFVQNIDDGEEYVKETAELKKSQFVGDLELAYVSGQIDNSNSAENKKEKILQVVDMWYEWACESSNYGFFAKVMEGYLEEIKRESKSREKDLLAQLDAYKDASFIGISKESKDKKIRKIQIAIDDQNYTVAEDLLAHADQPDYDHEEIVEEHFLQEFLDEYNDYYQPVARSQTSFALLVSNRTRNKEERGGKRLADNWLPGGSNLGRERLTGLLTGFGFNVNQESVLPQSPIGRFENFTVKTNTVSEGKRENYTHPIAAFGSGASQEGFRVVCLNGKYDAAGLIDVMKQIGNAKHTMILLDYALDKPERRILARKSKSELGDKLFVVVDRTVMMYMVKNYDETKATRMLMSLIVPFGYYQPYVWESSNVMPPEIFMGRKRELESIESPTGANIVYGGRQLGKSALLKKAKSEIDKDENGNRAVLVDIKHLDHKEAARKIGHALYDEGVLSDDVDTTDWDVLSRALRRRLQSEVDRIPYLLLLLDESDAFIESCEEVNYRPFDALKDIQSIGAGRFKFVIAGLRNIVRFKRDAALGNNSVLTHLEAMTVKPFHTNEARELMEIPLNYLGLVFPKENESLITLILASTNYFPGLIQMYCAKLLSSMRNKDYAGYDEADTPVYEVSEEHIKKVLADPEFMDQIKEKFIITLKLDEDNYYYLIALLIAYMYHNNGYNDGYSAEEVKEAGKNLGIMKIANLDNDKLSAFMDELKELNVLRSTDNSHYLFTRFSFFQMMGTSSDVDDQLVEYMEG